MLHADMLLCVTVAVSLSDSRPRINHVEAEATV